MHRIRTVEEVYLNPKSDQFFQARKMRKVIADMPEKFARLNKLAGIMDTCANTATFKRAWNEATRVLYGRGNLRFKGKEYNPDLLRK